MWRLLLCLVLLWSPFAGPNQAQAQAQARGCTAGDGIYLTRVCFTYSKRDVPYGHNVLGNTPEWTGLRIEATPIGQSTLGLPGPTTRTGLPPTAIYEDLAPRVADLSGDGLPEIIVVVSHANTGASLVVYNMGEGETLATPPIGTRNRWLAPAGIADFNKDGRMDVAYVDRPHLARVLRIWSYTKGTHRDHLSELDALEGLSNHRIGEAFIQGGVADCGRGPIIFTADSSWKQIMATGWDGEAFRSIPVGRYRNPQSFAPHLACR